jgi:hypothetical protein
LPLVHEPQAGCEQRNDRGDLLRRIWREGSCGARLIVILEEAHRATLVIGLRVQVTENCSSVATSQAIVELFVVGVSNDGQNQGRARDIRSVWCLFVRFHASFESAGPSCS